MKTTINPHKLTLTVSLKKDDQERLQMVYASQLYGTFFCIFGSFELEEKGSTVEIKGIYLRLINYKGLLNLGISGVSPKLDYDAEKGILNIFFKVQALINNDVLKYFKFKAPVQVADNTKIYFNRILDEIHDVQDSTGINKMGVFDSEFYDRDGLFNIKDNHKMDKEADVDWIIDRHTGRRHKLESSGEMSIEQGREYIEGRNINDYMDLQDETEESLFAPGGRCPKSLVISKL